MKAMILNSYGPEASFEEATLDRPTPAAGHVLVRIAASSVNTVDTMIRKMGKDIHSQEGMIFAAGYGAAAGLVLGLVFWVYIFLHEWIPAIAVLARDQSCGAIRS